MKHRYEGKWTGIEGEYRLKHFRKSQKKTKIFFNCIYCFICFLLILLFISEFVI